MADTTFPINEARIVALFMEAVGYGIYLVSLVYCVRLLLWDKNGNRKPKLNWVIIATTTLIAIFVTMDLAFNLRHVLDAFIFYTGPGGPIEQLTAISNWLNVMLTVDTQIMFIIVDGFLIYRCLVVYYYRWLVVAVPLLFWITNIVLSAIIIFISSTLKIHAVLSVGNLKPFITSFLVLNLATNMLTTGLIAYRFLSLTHVLNDDQQDDVFVVTRHATLRKISRVIIESGLVNLIVIFVGFVTFITDSNAVYPVSDLSLQVLGLTFNMITIRMAATTSRRIPGETAPPERSSIRFRSAPGLVTSGGVVITSVIDHHNPIASSWDSNASTTKENVDVEKIPVSV